MRECSAKGCTNPGRPDRSYCLKCHRDYMREFRARRGGPLVRHIRAEGFRALCGRNWVIPLLAQPLGRAARRVCVNCERMRLG